MLAPKPSDIPKVSWLSVFKNPLFLKTHCLGLSRGKLIGPQGTPTVIFSNNKKKKKVTKPSLELLFF